MAQLNEPGNEPSFDLLGSFGLDFFIAYALLLLTLGQISFEHAR